MPSEKEGIGDGLGCLGICILLSAVVIAIAWENVTKEKEITRRLEIEKEASVRETDPQELPTTQEARH